MKDLFLTPRGDLAIRNISSDTKRLEINFITSNSNALRLNFYIEDTFQYKPNANSLSINFSINKPEYNKEIEMVSGDAYMEQAIKIRLSTALGSLEGNRDIGSKLELIIHEFIDVQATHTNLEKLIKEVEKKMRKAAADLNFEAAAGLRDKMVELKKNLEEMD